LKSPFSWSRGSPISRTAFPVRVAIVVTAPVVALDAQVVVD
jgi:hypothetical protein